jgi:AcrR family transcriptional regulator
MLQAMPKATTAARGKRRQAREEARGAILEAADSFLREQPFRELTIDELMRRAGLSRTIFYRHFDDLGALITQLLWNVAADLRASNDQTVAGGADKESIRRGLGNTIDWFERNGTLLAAVADAATYDADIETVYDQVLDRWVERMTTTLDEAAAAGHIRPVNPADVEALVALNERYLLRKLGRTPQADAAEVRRALWSVWSRFLFGPEGGS